MDHRTMIMTAVGLLHAHTVLERATVSALQDADPLQMITMTVVMDVEAHLVSMEHRLLGDTTMTLTTAVVRLHLLCVVTEPNPIQETETHMLGQEVQSLVATDMVVDMVATKTDVTGKRRKARGRTIR